MPLNPIHNRLFITAALATAMMLAPPMANASESWFPDLIFPGKASAPSTKADETVTGSIPRAARQIKQTDRSMPTHKRTIGVDTPSEKEIEQ